ncbi:MAG: polysaccharide pyruvyl transferase family protein [Tepidiformaceae bacterium]
MGNQNLGDEALVRAVIENIRRRRPEAEVIAFTRRPSDTRDRHGIPAFPINRMGEAPAGAAGRSDGGAGEALVARLAAFLKRIPLLRALVRVARRLGRVAIGVPAELGFLVGAYRHLRGTDLLLVAGSGQLNDYWGGPWGVPFTLWKWALLARATRTKVAFLSLGAGPLRTRLGKFFIRSSLRLADYRSYRDDDSRRCVVALGVRGEHHVVPDLVFSLHLEPAPGVAVSARARIVGINPMPVFATGYYPESDPHRFRAYVETHAAFADWLLERGYGVRFFATQLLVDHGVIDEVRARMRRGPVVDSQQRVFAGRIGGLEDLVAILNSVDCVLATRYHGVLLPMVLLKPVMSIAYQRKSLELMRDMGQAEYAIAIDELTLETLQQRFLALERHRAEIVATLRPRLPSMRAALEAQYDRACTLMGRVA